MELREAWLAIIGKENVTSNIRICSNHFKFGDFIQKPGGKLYLRKGALPSKRLVLLYIKLHMLFKTLLKTKELYII